MPFCKKCGNRLEPGQKFCNKCGTQAFEYNNTQSSVGASGANYGATIKCRTCGAEIKAGQRFCSKCGAAVEAPQQPVRQTAQRPAVNYAAAYVPNAAMGGAVKKPNRTTLYIILASASVLLVVLIVLGIIFLPGLLRPSDGEASAQVLASAPTEAVQSLTQPPAGDASEPAAQAQTQPPTTEPTAAVNPNYYDQKVEVVSDGSSATLTLYEWQNGGWTSLMQSYATVGKNGVGYNYGEGKSITPKGTFNLGFCYGLSAPNTGLRFKQLQSNDIFVSDSNSKYYNCLIPSSLYSGSGSIEHTYNQFANQGAYNYNIFIEHNGDGESANSATPGLGSVITICGYTGALKPTLGCIDISSSDMIKLLSYLDQSKNPVIIIS